MSDSAPQEEAAQLLKSLIATRSGKLGVCTRKRNEIKALFETGDVDKIDELAKTLLSCIDDFKSVHQSVQNLLGEEEKATDNADWYEPRITNFNNFFDEVEAWKIQQYNLETIVDPMDSVSNVTGATSRRSRTSTSSAKIAAAEKAALEARANALPALHALMLEETVLKSKKEQMEVQVMIAAADARIKVLSDSGDAMNEYLEATRHDFTEPTLPDASAIEFAPLAAVPKTPLQMAVRHIHGGPSSQASVPPASSSSPQVQSSHDVDFQMLQTQKQLIDVMIMQQNISLLPKREVPVFDGDPLSFQSFIHAFKYLIEDKSDSCQDRLYFLEQFTAGQAKDLVRSCMHMDSRRGYTEARQLLKKHFGDEIKIANAYLQKALNWKSIKTDDGNALHAFALYLRECYNAMQDLEYMDELNVASNLKLLVSKFPYKLRERWRTVAYESIKKNIRIRFIHLVEFLETQFSMLVHPIFGDINDPAPAKVVTPSARMPNTKTFEKTFVTTVTPAEEQVALQPVQTQKANHHVVGLSSCSFCADKHEITDCKRFNSKPHDQKVDYLKKNGYCFGCLKKGHLSKNCNKKMLCQICKRNHPTLLHINSDNAGRMQIMTGLNHSGRPPLNSALVSAEKATGASKECALAIVPVQVKASKGSKTIQTYAFLDPGSSATFCTENIMRQLNTKGRQTEVVLRTMGQERLVKSYELTGLEVGNMDGSVYIELPQVYTQPKIPVSKENLLSQHDLKRWPYLNAVTLQRIDANIEILIGMNVPKAMEPWRVINSQGNGPYAVKTLLGWVVSGPLNTSAMEKDGTPSVTVNRVSMQELKDLLIHQYNNDFPEKDYEEKLEMSVEDKKFMDVTTRSVIHKNGHYHLPLPFRDDVCLPDNKEVSVQRAMGLSR